MHDLLAVVDRDLADAELSGLSSYWQFLIAYHAALQVAVAALAAAGYRATREAHHYRVVHSLGFTIGIDVQRIRTLDALRKKRNAAEYDAAGAVTIQEVMEMKQLARALRAELLVWLRERRPDLMP